MSFEKRVCVLKQVKKGFTADGSALSGAVYCERMGSELTLMPRLLGIAPVKEGKYALALWIEKSVLVTELKDGGSTRLEAPSIKAGIAILLVYIRGEAEPVAFGSCGAAPSDYTELLSAVTRCVKAERGEQRKKNAPSAEQDAPFREEVSYDDEAIADGNYFAVPGDGDGEAEGGAQPHEGEAPSRHDQTLVRLSRGGLTYYNTVREKLRSAFERFEKDERLRAVFPCSEWVKTENGLLGVIYENGLPKYLCVAAEGEGDGPPAEMKEHGMFVPLTPFSDTVGLFVVFQSADTGEYVTVGES